MKSREKSPTKPINDSMFGHSHGKALHLNFTQIVCGCNNF